MFKALLRKQWKETLAFYSGSGRTNKNSKLKLGAVGFAFLYLMVFVSLGFAFLGAAHMFFDVMHSVNLDWLYFGLLGLMSLALGMVGSIFTTYSSLYKAKDNELLLSMPIPPMYILAVRMISVFVISFAFEIVGMIPTTIKYLSSVGFNALVLINSVILTILLGFFSLTLSCALGFVVALISGRLKNKSISTTIISLALLAAYYIVYFNINNMLQKIAANPEAAGSGIMKFAYPFYLFGKAACGDVISLLLFAAIVIVLFVLCCILLSKSFLSIANKKTAEKKTEYKETKSVYAGPRKALRKRELKRFLSSSTYMLNCGLGIIFMLAGAVVLVIKAKDLRFAIASLSESIPGFAAMLPIIVVGAVFLIASFCDISAPSVSLEGNNIWILRSSPVDTSYVLDAKSWAHTVITLPAVLILSITGCIVLKLKPSDSLIVVLISWITVYLDAKLGLMLNLKMPNLEWTNEVVPIKQGLPVLLALFLGIPEALVFCGPFFLMKGSVEPRHYLIIVMVVSALLVRLCDMWINTKGKQIFESL